MAVAVPAKRVAAQATQAGRVVSATQAALAAADWLLAQAQRLGALDLILPLLRMPTSKMTR